MPKKNQIAFFTPQPLVDGRTAYHWKPSPRLRRLGWTNLALGSDFATAIDAAMRRNRQLEEWLSGREASAQSAPAPAIVRFDQLVTAYMADPAFTDLKPKSQAEYRSRLGTLETWATVERRSCPLKLIDRQMVLNLRNELVRDARKHRTAGLLRVLGIVMQFAENQGWIAANPAHKLRIPTPKPRRHRVGEDTLDFLVGVAAEQGDHLIALAGVLGFYTVQREGDLLASTGFQVRPIHEEVDAESRRALAGPDGRVLGVWLQQGKTGVPMAIPLHPYARVAVVRSLSEHREGGGTCTHLLRFPGEDRPCTEKKFQRDFRRVVNAAIARAQALVAEGSNAAAIILAELTGLKFLDLRRSGMCWMRDLGVPVPLIAALSGHSIEETTKILNTYLPRDIRAAVAGMAMAVTRAAERAAIEKEDLG